MVVAAISCVVDHDVIYTYMCVYYAFFSGRAVDSLYVFTTGSRISTRIHGKWNVLGGKSRLS